MNTVQNTTYTPIKSVPYDIKIFSALAIVALVVRMIFAEVYIYIYIYIIKYIYLYILNLCTSLTGMVR